MIVVAGGYTSFISNIDDGRDRIVTFRSDQNGMIVERDEADLITTKGDPRSLNYFFAGLQMGQELRCQFTKYTK